MPTPLGCPDSSIRDFRKLDDESYKIDTSESITPRLGDGIACATRSAISGSPMIKTLRGDEDDRELSRPGW
jgi:hypothetical protein